LDWAYISGFFDGEGGTTVEAPKRTRVLVPIVVITQKSRGVLDDIATFLKAHGIRSRSALSNSGINSLRIGRIKDIISFLSHLTLTVKARQVEASLDHLRGRNTGNELLSIFNEKFLAGRRPRAPLVGREWNRDLTRAEANLLAGLERGRASSVARNCLKQSGLLAIVLKPPDVLGVQDVARALGVERLRARYLTSLMRRHGLAQCELHYHSQTRTLVCKRMISGC